MSDPKVLMKEGEDALKLSVFKWEADHVAAASLFEQAGRAYRARGDGESAMGAYLKAVKSHLSKGGSGYQAAAAAYQSAAQAYPSRAAEMLLKSYDLYVANGNAEEATEVMGKAADSLEKNGDHEAALNLYIKAVEQANIDEFTRAIVVQKTWTILTKAFQKLIAARRLPEASKCANKMLNIQRLRNEKSPKMILQIVIVFLARGDVAAARQLVNANLEEPEFIRSSEGDAAQDLIDAYEKFDSEAIKRLVEGPIKYLDTQVVYLARELDPASRSATKQPAPTARVVSSDKAALLSSSSTKKPPVSSGSSSNVPTATPVKAAPAAAAPVPTAKVVGSATTSSAKPVEETYDFDLPDLR